MPLFLSTYFFGLCLRVQKEELQYSCILWLMFDITLVLPYQMKLQGTSNIQVGGTVLKEEKMFYVAERLSAWRSVNRTCRIQHY
jgi:hypothetical protein